MITKSVWIDKDNNQHLMPMYWYPKTNYGCDWYFIGYIKVAKEK